MQPAVKVLALLYLLGVAILPAEDRLEHFTLEITDLSVSPDILAGRAYLIPSATSSKEIDGQLVSIYRWSVSASGTDRVSVQLNEERWSPVEGSHPSFPARPAVMVHSPQVWGQIQIVLIDIYPWRVNEDRIEVLKEGRIAVTIRHQPGDAFIAPDSPSVPADRIANRLLVKAPRSDQVFLRKRELFQPEEGTWLKIPIREDGLYHLTSEYLSAAGVSLQDLASETIRLWSPMGLGRPMPAQVGAPLRENLVELAVHIRDGGDGQLGEGDDIIYYGQGPRGFYLEGDQLTYIQNPYANEAFVWLHIPSADGGTSGKRMSPGPDYAARLDIISTGRNRYRHEIDIFNGFDSGPEWHQVAIRKGTSFTVLISTPTLRVEDITRLKVWLRGGSESSHGISLTLNQQLLTTSSGSAYRDILMEPGSQQVSDAARAGQNVITLNNISTSDDPQEEVWLDWVEFMYGLDLIAVDEALSFLAKPVDQPANIQLSGFTSQPIVLDITDPASPLIQPIQPVGDRWEFTPSDLSTGRRFIAATDARLRTPDSPTLFQNLDFTTIRSPDLQADYIIITDATLLTAAQDLATIHSEEVRPSLRLSTLVVSTDEIYEEFSGGMNDPMALRAFLRWAYENWQRPAPRLVALFGDGDYDYRNLSGISRNIVPTIQIDGTSEISSRTADDHFVYLDSVYVPEPKPDMGIGRIAVATPEDAAIVVDLIRSYMVEPEPGSWRQRILLAADDPVRPNNDEPNFISQTEQLAGLVPPFLQIQKLYLTEYAEVLDPATNTVVKPDATAELIRSVNQGVTLINYIGHGSSSQWAQEQLLKMDRDRMYLAPDNRLSIWFAGTCTWGRYDQLQTPSMSEVITASSENAGIAVVSAVRAVYAQANYDFIKTLFTQTFQGGKPSTLRIGEILQYTKSGTDSDEKFHLFGDPALLIAFPREPLSMHALSPDTLEVLGKASYSGTTGDGGIATGECLVTVIDAPRGVTREYRTLQGVTRTVSYTLPGAPIFRGSASVSAGAFQGQFVVPKDINYSGIPASILGYAWSSSSGFLHEQIGYREDLIIQGTDPTSIDSSGPIISLHWEERPLYSGDALPEGAQLEVELSDPLGINLTGEVGHSIRLWIDDESSVQVMNPLFQYNSDSHTTGRFPYEIDPLLTGQHDIFIEAWDGANNKALSAATVYLELEEDLSVTHLYNYPNPFQRNTEFVYTLSVPATVTITIYTLNGVRVHIIESMGEQSSGFQRLPEDGPWDGRDAFGDQIANGAYLYHFRAETTDGRSVTKWGRLARLR